MRRQGKKRLFIQLEDSQERLRGHLHRTQGPHLLFAAWKRLAFQSFIPITAHSAGSPFCGSQEVKKPLLVQLEDSQEGFCGHLDSAQGPHLLFAF